MIRIEADLENAQIINITCNKNKMRRVFNDFNKLTTDSRFVRPRNCEKTRKWFKQEMKRCGYKGLKTGKR